MIGKDDVVLITGGATGIGFAIAEKLLNEGNQVIICGRREHKLMEAQQKLPALKIRVCDVAKVSEREALFQWVTKEFPNLNVLINNAGIQRDVDFLDGQEDWNVRKQEITINVEAPMHLSALFIPHLREKEKAAIVNVSSGLAFTPMALFPIYCATKAAVHSFTMSLRHQLRHTSIDVCEVIPPAVESELNAEGRKKRGGLKFSISSEEFASAVMEGFKEGREEIGYGTSESGRNASREEINERFKRMNAF